MSAPLLPLNDMAERHVGLTTAIAENYLEAARVCLDRHHDPPQEFRLKKEASELEALVEWEQPDERCRRAWANEDDATRDGAYACALAATELSLGLVAVQRAETLTGADYYLAPIDMTVKDLEDCLRLEVSGTNLDTYEVQRRLRVKVTTSSKGKKQPSCPGRCGRFSSETNFYRSCSRDIMSWSEHHSRSEGYASQAEAAFKRGDPVDARSLYQLAAEEEVLALEQLDPSKVRTLGITAVSAASLWFKAHDLEQAELVAHKWLARDLLPDFAIEQLREILQAVWNERVYQEAGIEFIEGDVLVSVGGREVVTGGAPLDLILLKVDQVRNIFYRIIEMLMDLPLRRHGVPGHDIREQFRPWLLQARPGSYQFAVRVQKPPQISLFPDVTPKVQEVTHQFLRIVGATAEETHEELENLVPKPDYRETFLKLSRNLAPTDKSPFSRLEIKLATDTEARPITLSRESRQDINRTLRKTKKPPDTEIELKEEQITGVLRGLHLDKDWLEVAFPGEDRPNIRIGRTGDVIDDMVGPMVNQRVIIDVAVRPDGQYLFRDIQTEE